MYQCPDHRNGGGLMYSGTAGITSPKWLLAYERYMRSTTHCRHVGIIIGPRRSYGLPTKSNGERMSDVEFIRALIKKNDKIIRRVSRGRKRNVQAVAIEIHTPVNLAPKARVTQEETEEIFQKLYEKIGGVIITQPHLGPTGDMDGHALSFRDWPNKQQPLYFVRKAMDEIHDELNQKRRKQGRPLLPTMREVQLAAKKRAGIADLSEQLSTVQPVTIDNLVAKLHVLGHKLGPKGIDERIVHVIHANKKKEWGYKIDGLLGASTETHEATRSGQPSKRSGMPCAARNQPTVVAEAPAQAVPRAAEADLTVKGSTLASGAKGLPSDLGVPSSGSSSVGTAPESITDQGTNPGGAGFDSANPPADATSDVSGATEVEPRSLPLLDDQANEPPTFFDEASFLRKIAYLGYTVGPLGIDVERDEVDLIHPVVASYSPRPRLPGARKHPKGLVRLKQARLQLVQGRQLCSLSGLVADLANVNPPLGGSPSLAASPDQGQGHDEDEGMPM